MFSKRQNDDMLNSDKSIAKYELEVKIAKLEVTDLLQPYIRKDSKIVYQCGRGYYKCRIPKALVRENVKPPITSKDENVLWLKLYDYLFFGGNSATVQYVFDQYLADRKADDDIASSTTRREFFRYEKYIKPHLGNVCIAKITPSSAKAFFMRITTGRQITRKELNNVKSLLAGIISYAIDEKIITRNPLREIRTSDLKCKPTNNDGQVFTRAEREKLLTYMQDVPITGYSLGVRFMFRQNICIGELKGFVWQDYDFNNRTILINKEVVERENENGKVCEVEIDVAKTEGGHRMQRVSPGAAHILALAAKLHPDHKPNDRIFVNGAGNPLDIGKFNEHLKEWCNAAGIRYLSSHKMRFYTVSQMARSNMDMLAIQRNSGHKDVQTTFGYIRDAEADEAIEAQWDEIFN